jgi:hypothetical protein
MNLTIEQLLPQPTRILHHQRRQRNAQIPRIDIAIQPPLKEKLDTALDAIVTVPAVTVSGLSSREEPVGWEIWMLAFCCEWL